MGDFEGRGIHHAHRAVQRGRQKPRGRERIAAIRRQTRDLLLVVVQRRQLSTPEIAPISGLSAVEQVENVQLRLAGGHDHRRAELQHAAHRVRRRQGQHARLRGGHATVPQLHAAVETPAQEAVALRGHHAQRAHVVLEMRRDMMTADTVWPSYVFTTMFVGMSYRQIVLSSLPESSCVVEKKSTACTAEL